VRLQVETEEKDLLKKANKQHMKSTIDVAQYNLMSYLHEITTAGELCFVLV
jgi:hypothetical protein